MAITLDHRLKVSDAWCEALFASWLQPSDAPTADTVAEAIGRTVRQFGTQGCAGRMAQEFGDHPEAAAERMRWVRQLAAVANAPEAFGGALVTRLRHWVIGHRGADVRAQAPRAFLTQPIGCHSIAINRLL